MQIQKIVLVLLLLIAIFSAAQNEPSIPREYQDLYSFLDGKISSFDAKVSRLWDGTPSDVEFGAELLTANCNRGRQLLTPHTYEGVKVELTRLQNLGARAVTVCIGFPLLSRPFLEFNGDPEDYQHFIDFYRNVSGEVHRRNMKLIVESSILFPGVYSKNSGLNLTDYYRKLDGKSLTQGRAEMMEAIIREVKPDYLNLGSEPDTQSRLTGLRDFASPEGFASQTAYLVKRLRAIGTGKTKLAAGVGTWQYRAAEYVRALATTGIDFIDLHIYPVNRDMLDRVIQLTDLAASLGKPVAISEAWLQKERDSELGKIDAAFDPEMFSRDSFSFWSPLDQKFLVSLVKFSHWKHLIYFSPFWSKLFWAYLDYDVAGKLSKEELMVGSTRAAAAALVKGDATPTAVAYKNAISHKPAADPQSK